MGRLSVDLLKVGGGYGEAQNTLGMGTEGHVENPSKLHRLFINLDLPRSTRVQV